jgi:transcriptional regulator with XRE-family HTH domain
MTMADLKPIMRALRDFRSARGLTQDDVANRLGISRKTYLLFESTRWFPPPRERGHFVKRLHDLDAGLAQTLVGILGQTLEDHVVVRQPAASGGAGAGPPLDAKEAKRAYDVVIYECAEELEMSPRALRPIAANVLARLAASGITLAQAAPLAKAALEAKKTDRG